MSAAPCCPAPAELCAICVNASASPDAHPCNECKVVGEGEVCHFTLKPDPMKDEVGP